MRAPRTIASARFAFAAASRLASGVPLRLSSFVVQPELLISRAAASNAVRACCRPTRFASAAEMLAVYPIGDSMLGFKADYH